MSASDAAVVARPTPAGRGVRPVARQIPPDVLCALGAASCDGAELKLGDVLPAPIYRRVDKVLTALGGVWDRQRRAHVFAGSALDALEPVLLSGKVTRPQDFGCFYTPGPVADLVVEAAGIERGQRVLEPSAGQGALATRAAAVCGQVDCVELLPANVAVLEGLGIGWVEQGDFLQQKPERAYDRVVMNPPFAGQADIEHVIHAFRYLRRGGRLAAVMSAGITFRENRAARLIRDLIEIRRGTIQPLPHNAFRISGTSVQTVLVTMLAHEDTP